ncbi:hypothetical protein [Pseudooceanicola sp.]
MFRKTTACLLLMGLSPVGGALADSFPNPPREALDVIPTDAIRVEVTDSSQIDCAELVIWAFNLPEGSLLYHPRCEVMDGPAALAAVRGD